MASVRIAVRHVASLGPIHEKGPFAPCSSIKKASLAHDVVLPPSRSAVRYTVCMLLHTALGSFIAEGLIGATIHAWVLEGMRMACCLCMGMNGK